jgi:Nif-specific ferredoxin III
MQQTRDGRDWNPQYLLKIDAATCIGCGRCYKVCGREVMTLKGINEDGEVVALDDEDDDEVEKKVMVMHDTGACIGCGACARVCPTNCQTHGEEAAMVGAA